MLPSQGQLNSHTKTTPWKGAYIISHSSRSRPNLKSGGYPAATEATSVESQPISIKLTERETHPSRRITALCRPRMRYILSYVLDPALVVGIPISSSKVDFLSHHRCPGHHLQYCEHPWMLSDSTLKARSHHGSKRSPRRLQKQIIFIILESYIRQLKHLRRASNQSSISFRH